MLTKFHCELNPIEKCWGQAKLYSKAYTNYTLSFNFVVGRKGSMRSLTFRCSALLRAPILVFHCQDFIVFMSRWTYDERIQEVERACNCFPPQFLQPLQVWVQLLQLSIGNLPPCWLRGGRWITAGVYFGWVRCHLCYSLLRSGVMYPMDHP